MISSLDLVTFLLVMIFPPLAKDLGEGLHVCERQRTLPVLRTESGNGTRNWSYLSFVLGLSSIKFDNDKFYGG